MKLLHCCVSWNHVNSADTVPTLSLIVIRHGGWATVLSWLGHCLNGLNACKCKDHYVLVPSSYGSAVKVFLSDKEYDFDLKAFVETELGPGPDGFSTEL